MNLDLYAEARTLIAALDARQEGSVCQIAQIDRAVLVLVDGQAVRKWRKRSRQLSMAPRFSIVKALPGRSCRKPGSAPSKGAGQA